MKAPPKEVNWYDRPAVVPLPGKEPYACELCRERIKPGEAVRWSAQRHTGRLAAHDECVRKAGLADAPNPKAKPQMPAAMRPRKLPEGVTPTIERLPGEPEKLWRAFLLWAMQHEDKRAQRPVARAIAVSEGSIRSWVARWHWHARVEGRHDADAVAIAMYRQNFGLQWGATEIPQVAANVVVPLGKPNTGPDTVPEPESVERIRAADQLIRDEIARKRNAEAAEVARYAKIADAGIMMFTKALSEGKVRMTPRDFTLLVDFKRALAGDAPQGAAGVAVETVRVRHARETGRDVFEAVAEDIDELSAIVNAIRRKKAENEKANAAPSSGPALRVVGGEDEDDRD